MKPHFIVAALFVAMCCAVGAHAQPGLKKSSGYIIEQPRTPCKVGQIFIVGNDVTQDRVILSVLGLYPAQTLNFAELEKGKRNLKKLGLFDTSPEGEPSVVVIGGGSALDDNGVYRDILVRIKETTTGQMCFKPAVNAKGLPVIRFGVEERNFDLLRIPTSLDDVWDGRAFRGAGQKVRIELIEFGPFGCSLPCLTLRENLDTVAAVSDSLCDLLGYAITGLEEIVWGRQEPAVPAAEPAIPAEPMPLPRKMPFPKELE